MDQALLSQLQKDKLPRHLAIVMDGNGRWAQQRNLPRNAGHRAGVKSVDEIVATCRRLGIPALTLFALSTENLDRPRPEVEVLMRILRVYLRREAGRMCQENIRFNTIGDITVLPVKILSSVDHREVVGKIFVVVNKVILNFVRLVSKT